MYKARNHKGFEPDKDNFFDVNEVNEKIRSFAKWVAERMPEHVAAFTMTVSRDGYVTHAIENTSKE